MAEFMSQASHPTFLYTIQFCHIGCYPFVVPKLLGLYLNSSNFDFLNAIYFKYLFYFILFILIEHQSSTAKVIKKTTTLTPPTVN